MTDEEDSSTTDSQSSNKSIHDIINTALDEHVAQGGIIRENSFSTLLKQLESSPPSQSDLNYESQDQHRELTSGGNQIITTCFENNFPSHCVGTNNSVTYDSGSVDDLPGIQETSPADSGYQPLSNDPNLSTLSNEPYQWVNNENIPSMPQREKYPGIFNFSVTFPELDKVTKNIPYTYSKDLGKLFVNIGVSCPVKFSCTPPPTESVIRAMIVFSTDEHARRPVARCINHLMKEKGSNEYAQHVLNVCDQANFRYEILNGHYCVVTPFMAPGIGEGLFTVTYRFGCLSSCIGGMNRRTTCILFTLEDGKGSVLGRDCIQLKVCSSPGRDILREVKKRKLPGANAPAPSCKQRPVQSTRLGYRILLVPNHHYEVLSKVNEAFETSDILRFDQREMHLLKESRLNLQKELREKNVSTSF